MTRKFFIWGLALLILILFIGAAATFFSANSGTAQKESSYASKSGMGEDLFDHEGSDYVLSDNVFTQTFLGPFIKNTSEKAIFRPFSLLSNPEATKKIIVSEKEVFSRVWPDFYIDYLRKIEKIMRDYGFIQESTIIFLNSDRDIYQFLLLTVRFMEEEGFIDAKTTTYFQKGITETLASVIRNEEEALWKGVSHEINYSPIKKDIFSIKISYNEELLAEFIESLKYIITFPQSAHAQFGSIPGDPIGIAGGCYKDFDLYFPIVGPNLWAPCCNCFVGPVPIGCLNAVCAAWPNAIWDPLTGICGCG